MSEYKKAIGGRLQLKGGLDVSLKKKKKKKRKIDLEEKKEEENEYQLVKSQGTGRILTSGTTVMGKMGTRFTHELSIGDALIIFHPTTLREETRIVTMVLSDVSISISSSFTSDLVSTTTFSYIKAPPEEIDQDDIEKNKKRKKNDEEASAFGTYAGGTTIGSDYTYRVKKSGVYGGYTIMKETADSNRSREDLLDIRSKKKGDRHCM